MCSVGEGFVFYQGCLNTQFNVILTFHELKFISVCALGGGLYSGVIFNVSLFCTFEMIGDICTNVLLLRVALKHMCILCNRA